MTTILKVLLQDVSPADIQALKARYPDATLRVETNTEVQTGPMNEDLFWAIIGLLDWKTMDSDQILKPAVEQLSQYSEADIMQFHDILYEKLFALDGEKYAEQLGSNKYTNEDNQHFSVDGFLYSRCCVVANGRDFYNAVLNSPQKMPKEFTFESLLYLPALAWKLKTGDDNYHYFPETWAETFSNPAGWPGIIPVKNRLTGLI